MTAAAGESLLLTDLGELQQHWEKFADTDALWSICSDPRMKHGKWDREAFFATGRNEISVVLEFLTGLGITVDVTGPALDFGCGVGRLSQALAEKFAFVWGIDISPGMVKLADKLNQYDDRCLYVCGDSDHLPFEDETFSFIYTSIVLQHVEPTYARLYLAEFLRVLKPHGVLVFQLPNSRRGEYLQRIKERVRLRTRIRQVLGRQLQPIMEMHCLPETEVRHIITHNGARIVDVQLTNSSDPDFSSGLRYLEAPPATGFVSKQYCVTKCSDEPGTP